MRMSILKSDLVKVTEEYSKENHQKWSNLSIEERRGLKSLMERRKQQEIVTNVTDKSGRFSVDSIENYISLNETHVQKDAVINETGYAITSR